MEKQKLMKLNNFINKSYECLSFGEFLKLSILKLHELVMYDSGMFFCSISKDCSFFKPYIGGKVDDYYKRKAFNERDEYIKQGEDLALGSEAYVYKSSDLSHGTIQIANEPRSSFLAEQKEFHIACIRIVHKGQFMGEIYLHRDKDKPDFDDEDMFVLNLMQPHVSTVFNIIHTVTAVKYMEANNNAANGLGMCAFDGDMSLIGGNVAGIEILKAITVYGSSVLYHIKELCMDITNDESPNRSVNLVFKSDLLKTPGGDIRLDIFLHNKRNLSRKTKYIVLMQYCDESQVITDYKFKFTKREADIIDGLIQGKNNVRLADTLNISENTVKTHIKSIYKKTGANNRTELAYVLMFNKN